MTKFLIATFSLLAPIIASAVEPLTLEHTFSGLYFPYNFPLLSTMDDARYFMDQQPRFDADTQTFSSETYNEDYSVRSQVNVRLKNLPEDYKVTSVMYNPDFKLPDGTPMIAVSLSSTSLPYGSIGYAAAYLYNGLTGERIAQIGESNSTLSFVNSIYVINGKYSFVVWKYSYDSSRQETTYKTMIYSFGTMPESGVETVEAVPENLPYVVETYDAAGRVVSAVRQRYPAVIIERMSDGTARKAIK